MPLDVARVAVNEPEIIHLIRASFASLDDMVCIPFLPFQHWFFAPLANPLVPLEDFKFPLVPSSPV